MSQPANKLRATIQMARARRLQRGFIRRGQAAPAAPVAMSYGPGQVAQSIEGLGVSNLARNLLAASLFLSVTRFHMFMPILAKLQLPMLLSVSAMFSMLAEIGSWRPAELGKHWIPKVVGLLIVIAVIGAPMSIYPGRSVKFLYDTFAPTVVLAIIAWGVARRPAGSAFLARLFAVATIATGVLAMIMNKRDREGRLQGAYTYDANDLALLSGVGIPLLIWWAMDARAKHRWIPLLAIPVGIRVVLQTGSRGGLLGLGAIALGLLIVALVGGKGKLRPIGLTLGLATFLSFPFLPSNIQDRIKSIGADDDYNMTSVSGRKAVWTRGVGYMMANPFLGVGIDNFRTAEGRLSAIGQERAEQGRGMKWSAAHNSFLQVGAELGLIAGSVFILAILAIPVALIRRYRRQKALAPPGAPADLLPALLAIAVMNYFVTGFFLSQAYGDTVYILMALSTAVLMQPLGAAPPPNRGVILR